MGALLLTIVSLRAQTGRVRIRVADRIGSAIPGAEVSLLGLFDHPILTVAAHDMGESVWVDLALGYSRFKVIAPGFLSREIAVTISNGVESKAEAQLEVAPLENGPHVETAQMPYAETLDLAPEPQPKPAKRKWWQIFR